MTNIANSTPAAPPELVPVSPFSDPSTSDVPYAGGKAANLGELTRADLPVPSGFVIDAQAYAAVRAHSGLAERLQDVLRDLDVEDTAALQVARRPRGWVCTKAGNH